MNGVGKGLNPLAVGGGYQGGFWQQPALGLGLEGCGGRLWGQCFVLAPWGVRTVIPSTGAQGKLPAGSAASADKAGRRWQQQEGMGLPGTRALLPALLFKVLFKPFLFFFSAFKSC